MHYDPAFWWSLASLSLIVLYAVLVFRNVDPLVATAICVGLGFVFNRSTPLQMGEVMENALKSFLALVGFIIMLGRGLGEVLTESNVSHNLVHKIVYGIGINTLRRVKIGIVISSLVIVGVLGTLAGGLAILGAYFASHRRQRAINTAWSCGPYAGQRRRSVNSWPFYTAGDCFIGCYRINVFAYVIVCGNSHFDCHHSGILGDV